MNIAVNCLSVGSPADSFVTAESWVLTSPSSSAYWVEAGLAHGYPKGDTRYLYWADSRPNGGGYVEHDAANNSAALKTSYFESIQQQATPTTWYAQIGSWNGTSTGNAASSNTLQAGTEYKGASSDNASVGVNMSGMGFYDASGNPVSGWAYSRGAYVASITPTGYPATVHLSTANNAIHAYSHC